MSGLCVAYADGTQWMMQKPVFPGGNLNFRGNGGARRSSQTQCWSTAGTTKRRRSNQQAPMIQLLQPKGQPWLMVKQVLQAYDTNELHLHHFFFSCLYDHQNEQTQYFTLRTVTTVRLIVQPCWGRREGDSCSRHMSRTHTPTHTYLSQCGALKAD